MSHIIDSMLRAVLCGAQWRREIQPERLAAIVVVASALALPAALAQAPRPSASAGFAGLWYDDTSQGAVEITPCRDRLCGRVVWLRDMLGKDGRPLTDSLNSDPKLRQRPICGLPVIGDLKPQSSGAWDEGWIYDPKQGKQFDVELKLRSADTLQVLGYLGLKFLSETFIWRRAPASLPRCA